LPTLWPVQPFGASADLFCHSLGSFFVVAANVNDLNPPCSEFRYEALKLKEILGADWAMKAATLEPTPKSSSRGSKAPQSFPKLPAYGACLLHLPGLLG
jgi:hypothetical protein